MFIDTFRNFIEIEGLKSKMALHLANISGENKRISDLSSKRESIDAEIKQFQTTIHDLKLKDLELKISALESSLSKLKMQMNMVKNEKELSSLNHEIEHTKTQLTELESTYFLGLEKSEELNLKILEHQEFLKGSLQSLNEIKSEAEIIIEKNQQEIINYQKRVDAILENEKPAHKQLYLEMSTKFKTSSACSFINHKNCSACRINIDANTVNNVENGRALELCPNCGRILLPNNLNLY